MSEGNPPGARRPRTPSFQSKPPPPFYVIYGKTSDPKVLANNPRIAALEAPGIVPQLPNGKAWDEIVRPATQGVRGLPPSTRHESLEEAERALEKFRSGVGGTLPLYGDREAPGIDPKRAKLQ